MISLTRLATFAVMTMLTIGTAQAAERPDKLVIGLLPTELAPRLFA